MPRLSFRPIGLSALLLVVLTAALRSPRGVPAAGEKPPGTVRPTVRDFGAAGDGQTDDSHAIQKAIDARTGDILFPAGVYRITRTIEIRLAQTGFASLNGQGAARIVMAGAGPAFRIVGTHGGTADPASAQPGVWTHERMPIVDGLEIIGDHPQADGIQATGAMQLTITRTNLRRLRHGVHLVERNRNVLVANCHVYDNTGVGIFLDHVNLHQTNIQGCHVSYNQAGGVVVLGGEVRNVHINGCDIESNMATDGPPSANVWLEAAGGTFAEVAISGCTIQHGSKTPHSANIRVDGQGAVTRRGEKTPVQCGHVTIADNVLSDVQVNVELKSCRGVTLVGNTFWQGYEHNLWVEDSSQIVVGSNVMERNPMYGATREADNAVVFRACRDCTITGLHLHNVRAAAAGLLLQDCQRFNVTGCSVLDCENAGIALHNVRNSRVSDCLIRDERPSTLASPSLVQTGGDGNHIVDNLTD